MVRLKLVVGYSPLGTPKTVFEGCRFLICLLCLLPLT